MRDPSTTTVAIVADDGNVAAIVFADKTTFQVDFFRHPPTPSTPPRGGRIFFAPLSLDGYGVGGPPPPSGVSQPTATPGTGGRNQSAAEDRYGEGVQVDSSGCPRPRPRPVPCRPRRVRPTLAGVSCIVRIIARYARRPHPRASWGLSRPSTTPDLFMPQSHSALDAVPSRSATICHARPGHTSALTGAIPRRNAQRAASQGVGHVTPCNGVSVKLR